MLDAAFVGRSLTITSDDPALEALATSQDVGNVIGPSNAASVSESKGLALVVVPTTSDAHQAEIHIGARSYLVELIQLDDAYPVAVAALLVDTFGSSDVRVSLIPDGQVIEER